MKSSELLNSLHNDVQSIMETVVNEFIQLPEKRLNWKEASDQWSILECFEHLNNYSLYYNPELRKSIAQARENINVEVETKPTWLGHKFINMMHPDNVKKQKTFKRMNPAKSVLDKTVLDKFLEHQNELLQLLHEASKVNLNKANVPVEFMKLLKLNLGDALRFVIVHELRHIKQAKYVKSKTEQWREPALRI